jgi:outer membrane cobalamin receptor
MKLGEHNITRKTIYFSVLVSLFLAFTFNSIAQTQDNNIVLSDTTNSIDLLKLPLEDLLKIKVVSAGKRPQFQSDIPASVTVITKNEIEQFGYLTLQEILQQVPGLYLWDDYHVRGHVNIGVRGFTSTDNIIILVNGVNQVEGVYNEYLLTKVAVPVKAIERIEVVRGPMSVLYGSGAFFGVINIVTDNQSKESGTNVSAVYGSNQYMQGTLNSSIHTPKVKLSITGSGFKTNGLDVAYKDMVTEDSILPYYGLSTDARSKGILQDKNTYFNICGQTRNFDFDVSHSKVERGGFLVQPTAQYSPNARHSTNFMFSYLHDFSDNFFLRGKFSYLTTNSLAFYFLDEKDSYFSFGYNSDAYEAEINTYWKANDKFQLIGGIFQRNIIYATNPAELEGKWGAGFNQHLIRLSIDSRILSHAIFVQGEYNLLPNLKIIGGFRLQQMLPYNYEASGGNAYISQGREHYTQSYTIDDIYPIPSLALIFSQNKHTFKLNYGKALRNPPLGQIADILFSTANSPVDFPQLIPSDINTVELIYNGLLYKSLKINYSLYLNDMKNLLSQYFITLSDYTAIYYTSNKGAIRTIGSELSVHYAPSNKFSFELAGMYQQSENRTPNLEPIEVPYNPDFVGYGKASVNVYKNIWLYTTATYLDGMETEYDYTMKRRIALGTDPSLLVNAGIRFKNLLNKNIDINIKSTNLLNSKIYYPATTLNQFADKGILDFPQRFFVQLTYTIN